MKELRKLMKKRSKIMKNHFKKPFKKKFKQEALDFINSDLLNVEQRAIEILNISGENLSEPVVVVSANTEFDKLKYRVVVKDDIKQLNYDQSTILTFLFGEKSLFYHEADVNHFNGCITNDFSGEVNYKDIINIETYFNNEDIGKTSISSIDLILGLINGDSLNLELRKHYNYDQSNNLPLLSDDEKYVIDKLRTAVRTVK